MTRGRSSEPFVADASRKVYVTPAYYELAYGRGLLTVREWARHDKIRSMWHNDTLYVHFDDCRKMDADTPTRQRTSKTA